MNFLSAKLHFNTNVNLEKNIYYRNKIVFNNGATSQLLIIQHISRSEL